jgi:hypothetical protein
MTSKIPRGGTDIQGLGEFHSLRLGHRIPQMNHSQERQGKILAVHHAKGNWKSERMNKTRRQDVAGWFADEVLVCGEVPDVGYHSPDLVGDRGQCRSGV